MLARGPRRVAERPPRPSRVRGCDATARKKDEGGPCRTALDIEAQLMCLLTSLVISNMLTLDLPPKIALSLSSALI